MCRISNKLWFQKSRSTSTVVQISNTYSTWVDWCEIFDWINLLLQKYCRFSFCLTFKLFWISGSFLMVSNILWPQETGETRRRLIRLDLVYLRCWTGKQCGRIWILQKVNIWLSNTFRCFRQGTENCIQSTSWFSKCPKTGCAMSGNVWNLDYDVRFSYTHFKNKTRHLISDWLSLLHCLTCVASIHRSVVMVNLPNLVSCITLFGEWSVLLKHQRVLLSVW